MTSDGLYDASAPPPAGPDSRDDLTRLRREQTAARLESALSRVADLSRRVAEQEAREGLDPEVVATLDRLSGRDEAPLAWRSLHLRVRDGRTSWETFWARPQAEEGGVALLHAVMREQLARAAETARHEPPQA